MLVGNLHGGLELQDKDSCLLDSFEIQRSESIWIPWRREESSEPPQNVLGSYSESTQVPDQLQYCLISELPDLVEHRATSLYWPNWQVFHWLLGSYLWSYQQKSSSTIKLRFQKEGVQTAYLARCSTGSKLPRIHNDHIFHRECIWLAGKQYKVLKQRAENSRVCLNLWRWRIWLGWLRQRNWRAIRVKASTPRQVGNIQG